MQVFLQELSFNHDPTSATADAFNIRKNETEPVATPEWRRLVSVTPEQSPAAYARHELKETPTILAKFTFEDFPAETKTVRIRALDANLLPKTPNLFARFSFRLMRLLFAEALTTNVLGSVVERDVELSNAGGFEVFELKDVRIADAGISVSNVTWRWQFRTDSTDWTDFETTTHRIYTVLKLPTDPWKPGPTHNPTVQTPWTEVLEYACTWAANAQTEDEAANLITTAVNSLGALGILQYCLDQSGAVGYVHDEPARFDCTDFLNLLRGHNNHNGPLVNCDDCAAFVATFSNIVGCDLFESIMGADFGLNRHERIGLLGVLYGSRFSHHTVAWKDPCGEDNILFDACVRVDSDSTPATAPHPLMIPKNIRFGRVGEHEYRFRLVKEEDEERCTPEPSGKVRRLIGLSESGPNGVVPHALINATAIRHDFQAWKGIRRLPESLFVLNFFLRPDEFSNWQLNNLRLINQTQTAPVFQTFWQSRNVANRVTIRIESHQRNSLADAHSTVLKLLSRFHLLDIKLQQQATFGDVVFAVPTNFVILFARANMVFLLRNVGSDRTSCEPLARALDALTVSKPGDNMFHSHSRLLFSSESVVKDGVRYLKPAGEPGKNNERQFKFFCSGEVSSENGQLVCRPSSEGSQSIEIFAIDRAGGIERQVID